jgi:Fe-S-cluster-containing dehydrogenase component
MDENISNSRRDFLRYLAAGTAAAGVTLLYRVPLAELIAAVAQESSAPGFNPADHDYAFVVHVDRCIGCGKCVQACAQENDVPAGYARTWVERYVVTDDGVYVDSPEGGMQGFKEAPAAIRAKAKRAFFVPKLCNHCKNAPCVQVCPVGATFQAPGGFVLVDSKHCIGCGYCVQACPYGARFKNPQTHVADKCTWCYHRIAQDEPPVCVEVCPTQARQFGDLKDPNSAVTKAYLADGWDVLKPEMCTESRCMYMKLPRQVV